MKKLIFALICILSILLAALAAEKEKPVSISAFPKAAQVIIKTHFNKEKVSFTKTETEWLGKSYDVIFVNGDKIGFDRNGNWEEIDCRFSQVPPALIPAEIVKHISASYPNEKILKIDRDSHDYEVQLSSGLEIKFNMDFQVIDIDR